MTAALRILMLVLLQILAATYFIAINVYAFTLMLAAKRADEEGDCKRRVRDGSVFVAALLGGAAGVYISMFVLKYRLRNLFFMVTMPVVTILNVYILFTCFTNDFWIIRDGALSHLQQSLRYLFA